MKKVLLVFLILCIQTRPLHAADEAVQPGSQELSNPFSDFVPFEDEYDLDDDERFMYFGRFFAVSLGTGMHKFGGNIGKVYNTALPVFDFRLLYFFDFRLAGQIGFNTSSHSYIFNGGSVDVSLLRLNGDLKYYFNTRDVGAAITTANPYAIAGISQTFRTTVNQSAQDVQKDNAFAFSGGLGMEFALKPRKSALGFEGRVHKFLFKDRFDAQFENQGVADTTGNMYSLLTTLTWFF